MSAMVVKEDVSSHDYMKKEYLEALQLSRLQKTVRRSYENVELFRKRMDERGLKPEDIRSLADIRKLPFTMKTDLRDTYPYGLFASPLSEVVRLHASSGTTGKPIVVGYNQHDIEMWADVVRRAMACTGMDASEVVQVAYGYGLFTGGLGAHYGAEALGATVIPISGGNTDRQLMLMRDFGTTTICCTPSYFNFMIEQGEKLGIDLKKLPLKRGIFGAEPWTLEMRKRIEENAGIKAFDIYGLSEIIGPGVAIECPEQNGLHVFEDLFYPEIIDPDTGEALPDGEFGELVLTTLDKEAMPMIRYRTRDLTRIIAEPCACGRTLRRIDRIGSRSDDMFIIRGVNVFPSQIEAALLSVEGTTPNYQIILYTERGMDNVEVDVEITEEMFSDDVAGLEKLQRKLAHAVESLVGIRIAVKLVAAHTIARSEGKARRVIDRRER
ncbi:MAG: phenylacetate--CoA ligase [Lentisphaeria bacterium]|nr:phenylacetate--CoA ligase [Lentisphaeria bacterium]MBR2642016.1 phenylacetate--CoA ligase [Lentisphaeria bacterium]